PGVLGHHLPPLIEPANIENAGSRLAPAVEKMTRAQGRVLLAGRNQFGHKTAQRLRLRAVRRLPVKPRRFVILTIRIVVSALRAPDLIAGEQHRRTVSEHHACEHRALHAPSDCQDIRVVGWTLDPPVGSIVLSMAIVVVLAVRVVVTFFVADNVGEGESVVGGDIVDRGPRSSRVAIEEIPGAGETGSELRSLSRIAAPKSAGAVAEPVVPFGNPRRVMSELIAAGTEVPWFG